MINVQLNELQRFVKNFFFRVLSLLISTLFSALLIRHYSAALLVDGFGRYNFLISYTTYFQLLITLGLEVVAVREIAANRSVMKEVLGALVPLRFLLAAAAFLMMLTPMLFSTTFRDYGLYLLVFGSSVFFIPLSCQYVFDAEKRMEFPSLISMIVSIAVYLCAVIFVKNPEHLMRAGVMNTASLAFTVLFQLVIYLVRYGRFSFVFEWHTWKRLLKSGIIIGFIQITVTMIHYINIILLEFMKGSTAVGLFSAAYRAMFMIIMLMGIFHNLMNPILFENYKKGIVDFSSYFEKYMKFMIFFGYGTTVIFIILAPFYLKSFYDLTKYDQSILCFRILMLSLFFMTVNSPLHSGLLAAHREKTLLGIIVFQFIVNLGGNLALIPMYGIRGSAVATVLTEVIGFPLYIYYFRKIMPVRIARNMIIAVFASVPMAAVLYYLPLHYIVRGIIGGLVMVVSAVILRGYTFKEINDIKNSLFSLNNKA